MIIKGKSRAGPSQLARHLGRTDTNERVDVIELGWGGQSMHEAFRDWQVISEGTKGKLGLYHANIDPDAKYEMTPEQWTRAVNVLEEELGLQGQPRAVILHEKEGREHIHVVWARTDMDKMMLRSDSKNYHAHERASLRLEQEFGHDLVPGKHAKRDREIQPEFPNAEVSHDEWQQRERGATGHRERKAQVTSLYEASDSALSFKAALEDSGYVLARGDSRDFVLLDADAKVHSLGRQLPGVKPKALSEFMVEIGPDSLPSVKEARAVLREAARSQPLPDELHVDERRNVLPVESDADRQRTETLRGAISERHTAALQEQELRHSREVTELQERQQATAAKAIEEFAKEQARRVVSERPKEPGGFERLWRTIRETVSEEARALRLADEARQATEREDRQDDEIRLLISALSAAERLEIDALVERQGIERADLLNEQARDLKRRTEDDARARQITREYEERRRNALEQDREGPERDPRAR